MKRQLLFLLVTVHKTVPNPSRVRNRFTSQLLFLLVTVSVIGFSCKKIDFPLPKKLCQIKQIVRDGPTIIGSFDYAYNNQRILTQLNFNVLNLVVVLRYEYDQHNRLVTVYENDISKFKLIYQNELVVRVDQFAFDQLRAQTFFTYDHLKRLVQKNGDRPDLEIIRYEYEGRSRNPKRKLYYWQPSTSSPAIKATDGTLGQLGPQGLVLSIFYEYEYDNKINPQATLVGHPLGVFLFGQETPPIERFEPIAENNIVYQKFTGRSGETFFNYMEYFITYQYDHLYPVKEAHRKVYHYTNPGIPDWVLLATATYAYECKND